MIIYLSLNIIIVLFGLLQYIYNSRKINCQECNTQNIKHYFVVIPSFIMLFIVLAFRGDFTADYSNYVQIFKYSNMIEFGDVFKSGLNQEKGYIFLNRFIGIFSNNAIYLMIITAIIILVCFYLEIMKNSVCIWLSILMFVTIGSYYTSFNVMRQIIAVSIIFAGSKYLYNRNFYKYVMIVLLASLFHKSALIMIVFYFILNYRFNLKKFFVIIFLSIITMLYLNNFISIIRKYFYSDYNIQSYGMTGLKFTNAIMPIAILTFTLLHYRKLNIKDNKINIWINAIVFFVFFTILGLKVQMVQRIAEFFAPYALLLVPLIITQIKNKKLRVIYIFLAIVILIAYNFIILSGTGYDPYYFIWQRK